MSRATFFRTFGSKEDVVFLDHETMLERLEAYLSTTGHDTASALRQGSAAGVPPPPGGPGADRGLASAAAAVPSAAQPRAADLPPVRTPVPAGGCASVWGRHRRWA